MLQTMVRFGWCLYVEGWYDVPPEWVLADASMRVLDLIVVVVFCLFVLCGVCGEVRWVHCVLGVCVVWFVPVLIGFLFSVGFVVGGACQRDSTLGLHADYSWVNPLAFHVIPWSCRNINTLLHQDGSWFHNSGRHIHQNFPLSCLTLHGGPCFYSRA